MAVLDVSDIAYVGFPVDTVVTAPDSNDYTAIANQWYGVPVDATEMTVDPAGPTMCMSRDEVLKQALIQSPSSNGGGSGQAMTVDIVRTSS